MQENDLYREFMRGVDVQATTDEFWAGVASTPSALHESVAQSLQVSRPHTSCFWPGSFIIPSHHCPPVIASDRLLMCNYGAGLLCFMQFCDSINIPEHDHRPASEVLVVQFAAAHAGSASAKTLNNWLCGLQFWHIVNGAPWSSASLLHHTRRGFSKMVPHPHIKQNLGTFQPSQTCRSLNSPTSHQHLNKLYMSVSIHIPWTKTTKEVGADISITACPHQTCPLTALEHHLAVNTSILNISPLFSYKDTSTDGWVPLHCSEVWEAQGSLALPGHAFCIGGATELLLEGIHPDIVATQGRWNSRSFLEYWRRIETILPLFLSSSFNTQRITDLDSVMNSFAQHHHLPHSATSS
ncbi:uncharacterized protein BJ212DRAFT_1446732 [Suillus subaureus]|uniref:Uncharacterized protein n=1 Tax=Suillus subaureus TaxID=48587 RepID=A0A9P7EBT8_9AGAM|nr:uncharacterized protein BJ212DRAFT_1446732 [Suillus subaureus]KAG1817141.1 hypothetical protein BJ212DRAFT_1446732 [Suillus subaureus]